MLVVFLAMVSELGVERFLVPGTNNYIGGVFSQGVGQRRGAPLWRWLIGRGDLMLGEYDFFDVPT